MLHWKAALRDPRAIATVVIALGGLAIFAINFPGSMEFDSFVELVEARSEQYSNWHPAIISWMLGVFDGLPGPVAAWFTGLDMALAFAAMIALLWLPQNVSWVAVATAAAMLLLPQFVLTQAVVWKDTQFADAVLTAFVCLAYVPRSGWRGRIVLMVLAVVLLTLVALIRENGIIILPGAMVCLVAILLRHGTSQRRAWACGAVLGAAVVVLALGTNALLQLRADPYDGRQEKIKVFQYYDIVGMVRRAPAIGVAILDREAPATAHLLHSQSVPRWSPVKNDTMLSDEMVAALEATPAPVIRRQWLQLISSHPGHYLALRAVLFRWVFQPPDVWKCHPVHVGNEGDPDDFKELGMHGRMDARDAKLKAYGDLFKASPAFSHAFYAVIAFGVLIVVLRRRNTADIALAGLIASAILFTATFLFVSIACDYRYLYLIDLSALAGALYVAADWRALFRRA